MMRGKWKLVLLFAVLVCFVSGGACEGKMFLFAFGAECSGQETNQTVVDEGETGQGDIMEPLEAELKVGDCALGKENFFMDDITLNAEVKGGKGPYQVVWHIRCQPAEPGDIPEAAGTCEELEEISGEQVILSLEGGYEVYLSVTDMRGASIESEVYPLVIDRTAPSVSVSEISEALRGHGIYGRREIPVVSVSVDERYGTGAISGLDQIAYHITDSSGDVTEGCLMQDDEAASAKWKGYLQPDPVKFADGKMEIVVTASDKAGNINHSETVVLFTDTREPVVEFDFDTEHGLENQYYSHRKVLRITVEEQNFDMACRPAVVTDNESGYTFTGWQQSGGKMTGMIIFSEDGEYGVTFSCKDLAGNSSGMETLNRFIIDKTAPVISVSYDNQQAKNEIYYCKKRTAVITVEDRHFREEDGVINIHCEGNVDMPEVGPWTSDGSRHTAEITFEEDGRYALSVDWTDPAGNQAAGYRSGPFIIDMTEPELTIEGVADHSSNNGRIAPEIVLYDENASGSGIRLSLLEISEGTVTIEPMIRTIPNEHGESIRFHDFGEEMDGIYLLRAEAEDMAGNEAFREIRFSVNRGGSAFDFSDETEQLFEKGFIRQPEDIVISESNIDWLICREISVNCNGEVEELSEGQDYRMEVKGSGNTRKQYTYTIPADFFHKEGVYTIHLYSKDRASNISSSDAVEIKAGFILDTTAPVIHVVNLEDRHYYHEKEHDFTAVISDNTLLESVRYYLDGQLTATYNKEELETMGGVLYLKTGSADDYQTIKLEAEDAAGNLSESEEWHILVNATQQTNRQSGWDDQEEESSPREAGVAVIAGIFAAAGSIGTVLILIKKKIKNKEMHLQKD